ncbi:2-hydroxymuconate tautomerase [Nocardioides zeae]|uniref:4-oxalocrotonate tautomerase n=1 Tax=Nocardioides zeae TaxID=1457234 RepID=A0AAJ1X398_9ACTN|nr:4-oxalocrotonate tautomerase [Nocardioides zeae]
MPHVAITLAAGRTSEQVRGLLREVHQAVARTTGARDEHIRVVVHEVPRTHWSTADTTIAEMDAQLSENLPVSPSATQSQEQS